MKLTAPLAREDWRDRIAVVIATGPSLADDQMQLVILSQRQGLSKVLTVNNAAERAPWADAHYAGDYMWFKHYFPGLKDKCRGEWWTQDQAASERWKVRRVRSANKLGLGTERVHLNGNSGAQAVNLAVLWGARRIVLLGFDLKPSQDGRLHYFGGHPRPLVQVCLFAEWLHKWERIAADAFDRGVEIVNATPGSALQWVPHRDLKEALR